MPKNIFKHFFSFFQKDICDKCDQKFKGKSCFNCKKKQPKLTKKTDISNFSQPLMTVSQAAKVNGVTRQAIHFAIKMKRLNARKDNDTWLIANEDLKEYIETRYSRSKSRREGELIFDKQKGYYSINEAAKFLNRNANHVYYLVRLGKLKTQKIGAAIVIQDTELHKYWEFTNNNSNKNCNHA